jgi:integrase
MSAGEPDLSRPILGHARLVYDQHGLLTAGARGKLIMASIRKRELPNGQTRYLLQWRDASGSHTESFKRETDAKTRRRSIESDQFRGVYVDPNRSKILTGDWADVWLGGKANWSPKSRERAEGIVRKHTKPRWGLVPLGSVTHADVQRWLTGLDLAPASVAKVHRTFSMILDYAVKDGRLATNVAAGVSLPRVRSAERRYLTHEQLAALADACGERYWLLALFLGYTGVRFGEAAALRVSRLDFLRRRALIAESATPVRGRPVFGDTKNHERREVPLPRFLIEDLARHVSDKPTDHLVFTGARGQVLTPQGFQRAALTPAATAIGVPGFHRHKLRHTAASLAIASGADVKVVQQMLGHKSATMTLDLYGHLFGDRLDTVADAMDVARTAALADVVPMQYGAQVLPLSRPAP